MPIKQTAIEFTEVLTTELVKANPHKLYIFGDNLLKTGNGGQAIIRDLPNTFGIPTKREPRTGKGAYFSDADDEAIALGTAMTHLNVIYNSNIFEAIVFPTKGIGTGRAHMKSKSPILYTIMKKDLADTYNYVFEDGE